MDNTHSTRPMPEELAWIALWSGTREPKALKNETWRTFILHYERETPDGMNRRR